jgi:hypothetical protein
VMGVEIDDEDLAVPQRLSIARSHRDVVHDAETEGLVRLRMMTGRPYCAERPVDGAAAALFHGFHDRAGGAERGVEAAGGNKGIRVELSRLGGPDFLDVVRRMDAFQVFRSSAAGIQDLQPVPEAGGFEGVQDAEEALRGIGVPRRRLMAEKGLIEKETHSVHEGNYTPGSMSLPDYFDPVPR